RIEPSSSVESRRDLTTFRRDRVLISSLSSLRTSSTDRFFCGMFAFCTLRNISCEGKMLIAVGDRTQRALWSGFMRSAAAFSERPAIVADGKSTSYKELREAACRIAATLQSYPEYSLTPLTAVFAYRTLTAFSGVLGSLLGGNGYVPLNRTFPIERTQLMFERSECCSIVVDALSMPQLGALLHASQRSILVLLPDVDDVTPLREQWSRHQFVGSLDLKLATCWREPVLGPNAIAYLLFTSGSTGVPKGVMVAHRNV